MAHSVSQHLRIDLADYDATIRRFIRGYEEMLDQAVDAVLEAGELTRVLDLGAGTGALSERLLRRHSTCVIELWDVDEGMLSQALERLEPFSDRVVKRSSSFFEVDGKADAIMASLSLHHVRDLATKTELYDKLAKHLRPGGHLVNADVTIASDAESAEGEYQAWADHQVSQGFAHEEARAHFDEWAEQDTYFSIEEEMQALRSCNLVAQCRWRLAPSTVTVAVKP